MSEFRCALIGLIALSVTAAGLIERRLRLGREVGRLDRHQAALDHLRPSLIRRTETNGVVVADVIAGRLGLLEAAARVHAADAEVPFQHRARLKEFYQGASDEERACRQVIQFVKSALEQEPGRCDMVVGRLEAELRAYLSRYGGAGRTDAPDRRSDYQGQARDNGLASQ
jgi:hypothetical protein